MTKQCWMNLKIMNLMKSSEMQEDSACAPLNFHLSRLIVITTSSSYYTHYNSPKVKALELGQRVLS